MFDADLISQAVAWRHDFHRYPELGFEETRTSETVARLLSSWGWHVHRGMAKTGVVARLGEGTGLGLRADMDALPIVEVNDFAHKSTIAGKMHACGHDGHTAMLLLAAQRIAELDLGTRSVTLIFQPSEENDGGALAMIEEGLFEKFPCEAIYAIHNWPSLPVGQFAARDDSIMAAFGIFDIVLRGTGGHAAMPELSDGVLAAAGRLIPMLQEIPARRLSPLEPGVVSVTQIQGGAAYNVCPDEVHLAGCARWFGAAAGDTLQSSLRAITERLAAAHGCTAEISYDRSYPATINTPEHAATARRVAAGMGLEVSNPRPSMASEDFSAMLEVQPGAYLWLGAAREGGKNPRLHAADYDFNDAVLAKGAEFWVRLVEDSLR
ncbi:amidohydrolase [Breoghania sp.]|uniref:amidohydrolase n=1 Tax=Breoghania sp. TaxID=2065378 RepID=UPI002615DA93|nr:amidohydrolase [Breoghania sp.]MDJ0931523.1 amidohydrolase [Breoghania sp.]